MKPKEVRVPAGLLALALLVPLLALGGLLRQTDADIAGYAVIYAILAVSLNLLLGYAGQLSLGQGALLGMGAFTTGVIVNKAGLPPSVAFPVSLLASIAVGGLSAVLVGLPALRLRGVYVALATFGFADVVENYFFNLQNLTGLGSGITVPRPQLGPLHFVAASSYLSVSLVALAVVWFVDTRFRSTRSGRALVALAENEQVASSFGVRVPTEKMKAFLVSGFIAGLAGALFAYQVTVVNQGSFTVQDSLFFLVIVVVGGLGSRAGVVVAAVLFTALPRLLAALQGWDFIVGALLLVFTLARHPGGLPDMVAEARDRRVMRRRRGADEVTSHTVAPLPLAARRVVAEAASDENGRLVVRGVSVRFGGLAALTTVDLEVAPGEVVGLIGPNGAGKSTLFNVINGLERPDSGTVAFAGRDVSRLPAHARARLGMSRTFQQVGLVRRATVTENLMLAQHGALHYTDIAAVLGSPRSRAAERLARVKAAELLAEVGLEDYADIRVQALSTGQQRLVELACALASEPQLLLLDEPSAGMSPAATEYLAEVLVRLRRATGTGLLLVEHYLPLVTALCERCYVLDSGRVIAQGPTREVIRVPEVVTAYLGEVG
ncbi:MAG: branched-chain amino acid ABC transporter ATP-binding protein/permease [Mycobacteriales bacterium]